MEDQRQEIFNEVRNILKPLGKRMKVMFDTDKRYELFGKKKVNLFNKEHDGCYFASVILQKNFVGFYFFCQYTHPKFLNEIPENLKKCLKGKSCYHLKKMDAEIFKSLKIILKKGYDLYKKSGLI
jgi:hypothetical protein